MITNLLTNLNTIYSEVMNKLVPENIKNGVNILNVTGNLVESNTTNLDIIPTTNNQFIIPNSPYTGFNVVNISAVTSNIDSNIQANNIKAGVNILNVTGTYTSDANATSGDIVNNMIAYVNGQKIIGNLESINYVGNSNTAMTNIRYAGPNGGSPIIGILVLDTISDNDTNKLLNPHTPSSIGVEFYQLANFLEITPNKIKSGENILRIPGNVIESNTINLDVTLTTNAQSITPNSPYNGFNVVNIPAVTASIDNNITAENIKSGITILGITGNYETDLSEVQNIAANILGGNSNNGEIDNNIRDFNLFG